jgi:hypothetical protein
VKDEILKQIFIRTVDHFAALQTAIGRLEQETNSSEEAKKNAHSLKMVYAALNDVMHPVYPLVPELFPDIDIPDIMKTINENHALAVKNKLFPPCKCKGCIESNTSEVD